MSFLYSLIHSKIQNHNQLRMKKRLPGKVLVDNQAANSKMNDRSECLPGVGGAASEGFIETEMNDFTLSPAEGIQLEEHRLIEVCHLKFSLSPMIYC